MEDTRLTAFGTTAPIECTGELDQAGCYDSWTWGSIVPPSLVRFICLRRSEIVAKSRNIFICWQPLLIWRKKHCHSLKGRYHI